MNLSRKSLLTIYKYFVRSNLDYADIIYGKPFNESFKRKISIVQHKAALVTTGAIKGTCCHILYQKLGLGSLTDRRWSRRLFFFHKITQEYLTSYFQSYYNAISEGAYLIRSTTHNKLSQFLQEPKCLRILFFHSLLSNGVNSMTILEI